jgi:large subunit ribosomal protein L24
MVQLKAVPGRNAVRQAKKAKEINHIKGAIVWHEKQRQKRKELMQDRFEAKQAVTQRLLWERRNIFEVRRQALRNAAEDWKLGPLRPNRALDAADGKYGVVTGARVQKPDIPVKVHANRNRVREKKGLLPDYPLVVDDNKYFPIVKGDRVVVIKGKDKGKMGTVTFSIPRTHEFIVRGLNLAFYDADNFNTGGQDIGPRRESELPIPLAHLRLVVPYASTSFSPNGQSIYEDVIVDNILMERHTTGIDPFTGTDYGHAQIPEKHQYDPETGLPIFHRYIAGTRYRIAWPWETESNKQDSTVPAPNKKAAQGILSKTLGTLRHPITTLQSWRNPKSNKKPKRAPSDLPLATQVDNIEHSVLRQQRRAILRSQDPMHDEAHDTVDTTRNIVEGAESMSYTLVAPPFPETLSQELRGDIQEHNYNARNDSEAPHKMARRSFISPKAQQAQEFAQKKAKAAQRMKTPMQLRWESDQAKKHAANKAGPAVDTDTLLAALGQHMSANGVKLTAKRRAAATLEELD